MAKRLGHALLAIGFGLSLLGLLIIIIQIHSGFNDSPAILLETGMFFIPAALGTLCCYVLTGDNVFSIKKIRLWISCAVLIGAGMAVAVFLNEPAHERAANREVVIDMPVPKHSWRNDPNMFPAPTQDLPCAPWAPNCKLPLAPWEIAN
jgi:hypothetical protein